MRIVMTTMGIKSAEIEIGDDGDPGSVGSDGDLSLPEKWVAGVVERIGEKFLKFLELTRPGARSEQQTLSVLDARQPRLGG